MIIPRAPQGEGYVPNRPVLAGHRFVDVMDAKQVVIDNAFNSVEDSKTEQHCPDQEFRRPVEMRAEGTSCCERCRHIAY